MNKKGFLLGEETLKIVIAVIAIGFLLYFLTALYFANADQDKIMKAEAVLDKVSNIIDNTGITSSEVIYAIGPSGWYLFSFIKPDKLPNNCLGESCLCICKNKWINSQTNECDEKGACLIIKDLNSFNKIKIEDGGLTNIEVNKQFRISIIKK